jgi:hypothetical protein
MGHGHHRGLEGGGWLSVAVVLDLFKKRTGQGYRPDQLPFRCLRSWKDVQCDRSLKREKATGALLVEGCDTGGKLFQTGTELPRFYLIAIFTCTLHKELPSRTRHLLNHLFIDDRSGSWGQKGTSGHNCATKASAAYGSVDGRLPTPVTAP